MNTSLILSSSELSGLAELLGNKASEHFNSILIEICTENYNATDVISNLLEKRLACYEDDTLILEPFLKLIINEAYNAKSLYNPINDSYALICPNMHLLFSRYEWAENFWRIEPYKDKISLISSLR